MRFWKGLRHDELISALAFVAAVLVLVVTAAAWPAQWNDAAQATLAAGLIGAYVGIGSICVKAAFDRITLETQYRHNVRQRLVESSYVYACEYLMPLAGSAVELGRNIEEYQKASSEEKRESCLDAILYCLAQYLRVQLGLIGTIPTRESSRPLGLFLTTKQSEDRVWDLMMPPWAFDMRSLETQALLVESLYATVSSAISLRTPTEFIAESRDPATALGQLRTGFRSFLAAYPYRTEMQTVLYALGELVDYEVRRVLSAWYTAETLQEPARLGDVKRIPAEIQQQLGISYRPVSESGKTV